MNTTPLLVNDAIRLNLEDKTTALAPHALAIEHNASGMAIHIKESLKQPLIICGESSQTLQLTLHPHVHAHVIMSALFAAPVRMNLAEHSHGQFYHGLFDKNVVEAFDYQLQDQAELAVFELGFAQNASRSIHVAMNKAFAKVAYFGLDQLQGSVKKSTTLTIFHGAPHTMSEQVFRGIYDDNGDGSFLGKVIIDQSASESSAKQLYKAILLSEEAKAYVMPQLEINNSDITASHGASIGELDEEALFYLWSRGVAKDAAQKLLLHGLVQDVLSHLTHAAIKDALSQRLHAGVQNCGEVL